jgi:ABC-type Fe3+ transport system permease subunit
MDKVADPDDDNLAHRHPLRLRWPNGLTWAVLAIAAAVALPIVAVLSNLLAPSGGLLVHLARTVLPTYVMNTVALMLGVGLAVTLIGTGAAWLVTMCRFPGRSLVQWALLLPFAVPSYVLAYVYTDLLDYAGPVQTWLRGLFGWGRGDYWFPHIRSLPGAIAMLALVLYPYVYLLARTAFVPVGRRARGQPRAGTWAVAQFLAGRLAHGPAGHRGRPRAGADGNARRFWHGRFLRRPDLHHGHLPDLVPERLA